MRGMQKEACEELLSFLSAFSLESVMSEPDLKKSIAKTFKRYYPLLVLEQALDKKWPWDDKTKVDEFRIYFREAISDICQALVLAAGGFYKPAQLSLRCGLENWIRCIGLAEDQNVLSLKSVYELIDLVKSTRTVSNNALVKQYFFVLRNRYTVLCGYVHTANASHMALTTVAGAYPRYIPSEAESTFSAIEEVCSRMTWIFCVLAQPTYRGLHHKHFDLVSDVLPKKLKAALRAS